MRSRMLLGLLGLVLFFLAIWCGFYLWNPSIKKDLVASISIESEDELGDLIFETLDEDPELDLMNDPKVDSFLNLVLAPVMENHEPSDFDFRFYILDDPLVNAFTIPGGRIFIGRGLIELVKSQEEFLSVVGHEMGHVHHRHVIEKLARELGINLILSIISGSDAILISDIGHSLLSSGFDRSAEKEADQYSLELLVKAGIHPHHMATFFRRLNREKLSYDEDLEFLMSHPHNNARIKAALEYEIPEDFERADLGDTWSGFIFYLNSLPSS